MLATNELSINGVIELNSNEMTEIDGGVTLLGAALIVGGSIVLAAAAGAVVGYVVGTIAE